MLPESTLKIDDDVNVLWVVHPAMLDDATEYALDQFVLRGGRALIFVDPMAEILGGGAETGAFAPAPSSNLERLFKAWGVEFSPSDVVADNRYALNVRMGQRRRPHSARVVRRRCSGWRRSRQWTRRRGAGQLPRCGTP